MNQNNKIRVDDLSYGLYRIQLDGKNHRIVRVIRTLILRNDFIDFLNKAEAECVKKNVGLTHEKKPLEFWAVDFEVSGKLVSEYMNKVEKSQFFNNLSNDWQDNFYHIAQTLLTQTYIDAYANLRNKNNLFGNMIIYDDTLNYPNITSTVFNKEIFWKIFEDAFYRNSKKNKEKYGKDPREITFSGPKLDDVPKDSFKEDPPKVCQLIFDDTTEKQELIDFINKKWSIIEGSLKALRPRREYQRMTSSQNFLRDIDIYNKYQEYKNRDIKNPDVKTWSWLKDESEYKIDIEPNTIRKIVSSLKTEIEEVNTDK